MGNLVKSVASTHKDDGAGVVLDVVCVGLSIALIPTGLGLVGLVALGGASIILVADSIAYGAEMTGNDEFAEATKKNTEVLRIVATVVTLPDGLIGGWKVLRELGEVRSALAVDKTTAQMAEAMAQTTTHAKRTEPYRQIAERAHLRAQIRAEQLRASLAYDIAPRGAGFGSLGLLVREQVLGDDTVWKKFLKQLRIHTVAIHT